MGNVLHLIANILAGIFLPIILGVTSYGYYRIYILYTSYCGLLHFGFIDGILLKYAGMEYSGLDRRALRCYTRAFMAAEVCVTLLTAAAALVFAPEEYKYILVLVGTNLSITNITQYYQYLSQAVSRYREFTLRKVLSACGMVLAIASFYIGHRTGQGWAQSYYAYIISIQLFNLGLLFWYVFTYREITFGVRSKLSDEYGNIRAILKTGIIMTVAYETSRLVLVIDQQFVSLLFDIKTYSQYSFAYNMLSCVTALITGISTVMLPKLKRQAPDKAMQMFPSLMSLVTVLVCFFLAGYHPMRFIVTHWLPAYSNSLVYFQLVFPILGLSSCITIIIFTFYKILNECKKYLIACMVSLVISAAINGAVYAAFHSAAAISAGTLLTVVIWYRISIQYLAKQYHVKWKRTFCYTLTMVAVFYASTFGIKSAVASMGVYLILYLVITFGYFRKSLILFRTNGGQPLMDGDYSGKNDRK